MTIDPTRIVSIVLVATEDQPPITGFPKPQTFPLSAWAAVNPTLHAISKELPEPPISSQIVPGAGLKDLADRATTLALDLMSKLDHKAITYLQFKTIPAYPPNRTGPQVFALLTVCRDDSAARSDVVNLQSQPLLPLDASQDAPELAAHLRRNEIMWRAWRQYGINEHTKLSVDFQFAAGKLAAAETLRDRLQQIGFTVALTPKRSLMVFKSVDVQATEQAAWPLDRLQTRTRELFQLAASLGISLQGIGAAIPSR